jgi:hypothetical protein
MYEGFDPDKMYGMSLYDASDSLMHVYRWNADGTEYVVNSVSNGGLMFSGPAWSEGSKCIGAFVEFEAVFGGWNGEGISPTAVEAFSGGGAAWAPGDAEEAPRYEFKLGEGKVKIYADEDGTKLMENTPVLVQLGKEDVIGPFKPREIGGNFPGDLQGAHWDAIANYAARLGETKEAVAKEKNPYFVEDMYGQDCYADDEGVLYRYASTADSDEKSCVRVEVPAAKIFPGLRQNDIEPYEFLRMVGIRAAWYVDGHYPQYLTGTEWVTDREADGECVYVLNAPIGGARVSVSSGINGNIRERDRVFMKSAVE